MNFTDREIEEFNAAYDFACKKMEGLLILEEYRRGKLNFFERIRAKKAIESFERALLIDPAHWQSMFFLGKIYQRMNLHEKSLAYFELALGIEHVNHNLPQEAALAAMHLSQTDKAIKYSAEAIRRKPNDAALLGNHAMNLLIAGQDQEALETISLAISLNFDDKINRHIFDKISGVISGSMKRPTFADVI
ncbi:hypothetical protein [Chitinophaga sp.]|uniref:hypothetical protein n=1 Tax=Chitinophaga sp. TaxID=1869181 RepID=UPI0031DD197A